MPSDAPRIAAYQADPSKVGRVLLLYSGGLDTSVMVKWIQERYGAEIVTLTVDLGQPGEEWAVVTGKAEQLGAVETILVDAREEFANDYVLPAIKANAVYGGGYPLFTALARPLIAKLAVEAARGHGCDTIAHGCTGKGNDQVRIEGTIATLDPELRIIAPVREWQMGREEEIAYAREHGIPVKGGTEVSPYSIDDNLWGRSSEGRAIEDLGEAAPDDVFQLVTRPEEAPDEPETVTIGFERGRPVSIDGERRELVELLERAAQIGQRHGVGIVDHLEDRVVGLKVRDIYEVPAAAIVLAAHHELEQLVCTIHQNNFKGALESHWAYLCYAGLWLEPLRRDIDAYMDSVNEFVTGEVALKLYRGSVTPVRRSSPYALYDRSLASFGESGGDFSQHASPGFIELFTMQSRLAHRIRKETK
ncbi:MAG: argininosuccinate synthase [Solirubrobacterales bacterium]|nr:argininosuccinate synthase [Solirubrobacterales bacterium]